MEGLGNIFSSSWVTHKAYKIKYAKTIWVDKTSYLAREGCINVNELFLNEYAYSLMEGHNSSKLEFIKEDCINLTAERYGGDGLGSNGGGGRCGNIGLIQLKGIGPTAMVGAATDEEHGYGGLDSRKAIIEIIYTKIFNLILPFGVVDIHGLIHTGDNTAMVGGEPCWGGIMVRDQCLRPAHLMSAYNFKPSNKYKNKLIKEPDRLRNLYRKLELHFETKENFINWIAAYLYKSAKQFGFSRALRITHGTISPSNVCMDGKWLDLPAASFLSGGKNYNIWTEFFEEQNLALEYALEIIYNYEKFTFCDLNPKALIDYYYRNFNNTLKESIGYVLGMDKVDLVNKFDEEMWGYISKAFYKVIHLDTYIFPYRPQPDKDDPVISLIHASFLSLANLDVARYYFDSSKVNNLDISQYAKIFNEIISFYIREISDRGSDFKARIISLYLISLKRAYFTEQFFLPVVNQRIKELCASGSPHQVQEIIDEYIESAKWVFLESDCDVVIFKNKQLEITYSLEGIYCIKIGDVNTALVSYAQFVNHIRLLDSEMFELNQINFRLYFERFEEMISVLENVQIKFVGN